MTADEASTMEHWRTPVKPTMFEGLEEQFLHKGLAAGARTGGGAWPSLLSVLKFCHVIVGAELIGRWVHLITEHLRIVRTLS
jgi:hypothetical protein